MANHTGKLLLAIMVITFCYLMVIYAASASIPALQPALGEGDKPPGAPILLSTRQVFEIFSKFPSSASMSAIAKVECEDTCGFWHSFRLSGRQGGDYKDHILSDNEALVPYNDHILDYNDHFLPDLDPDPHS